MADKDAAVMSPETFAATLSQRQLHCRELGHNWKPLTVSWDRKARAYDRQLRCSMCRTIRRQVLDSSGHVLRNGYAYPDGYLATGVQKGITRDVFRLEAITRFLEPHEQTKEAS
jgi:hypothetical protein